MKIKFISLLFFLFVSMSSSGQGLPSLFGTWKYHDVHKKEAIDSTGLKMLQSFFGNMTMTLNQDGSYSAKLMDKDETGKWMLDKEGKTINMNSSKGKSNQLMILSRTTSEMVIKVGNGSFILKKNEQHEK